MRSIGTFQEAKYRVARLKIIYCDIICAKIIINLRIYHNAK